MKATLEWELPEEQLEFEHFLKGRNALAALDSMAMFFRSRRKHDLIADCPSDELDQIIKQFQIVLAENDIDLG